MFQRNKYIFSYEKKRQAATIKKVLTVIFVVLSILIALFVAFVIYNSTIHIDLANERKIQVNTEATAEQFIESIGNGRLVEDVPIDTSKVGLRDVNVKIKVGEEIRDYTFTVDIIDTQAPVITVAEDSWNVMRGTPIDVLSSAEVTDNSGESIPIALDGEYNPNQIGQQTVTLSATDSSGNESHQNIYINVIEITKDMPDTSFLTTTGHQAEIKDGILYVDGILIVNKSFGLPADYGNGLEQATIDAMYKLFDGAVEAGYYIDTVTEYRAYRDQELLFEYWSEVAKEGENTMSTVKAGHSEHQTGLALDIDSTLTSFAESPEGQWLAANCQKYGFIMRYPRDKVDVTGCSWEPWHIRYVGTELAEKLYNGGNWITLEEYFGIPSEYLD